MSTPPPAAPGPLFDRAQRRQVAALLAQRLRGPVALELWTQAASPLVVPGRAPCRGCGPAEEVARTLAALHPAVTLTRYDRDRHADRARAAAVEFLPTLDVRGRRVPAGRAGLRFVGVPGGPLLGAFLDALAFVSAADGGLSRDGRTVAEAIEDAHHLRLWLSPADPFSPFLLRLAAGIAAQQPRIRLEAVAIAEFPEVAGARGITHVPAVEVDGLRAVGLFSELELLHQLREAEAPSGPDGTPRLLPRHREDGVPYRSLAELERLARTARGGPPRLPSDPLSTPVGDADPA